MKILYILVGVIVLLFIIVQIWAMISRIGIETYPYKVEKEFENFEIRNYEASLFTTVKVNTSEYEEGSSTGFRSLGGYIFGGNEKKEKIAMTSPVTMSLGEKEMEVMFMVPKDYNKNSLPNPNDKDIKFKEMPSMRVAAITFGGWANDEKIEKYKKELISKLEKENIPYTDKFFFMGYNPPYDMIGRKNEVIVQLK